MFHDDLIKIIPKILNKKGIINVGGKFKLFMNLQKNNPSVMKKSEKIFPPIHQ